MKKIIVLIISITLMLTGCMQNPNGPQVFEDLSEVRIGILQFAQHPALDQAYQGFVDTITKAGVLEDNIDYQNASGEPSNSQTIAEKFVNNGTHLIYTIATDALQAAANKTMITPIIGSAVTNFETTGVVDSHEKPNTNVSGASDLNPVKEQIALLHKLAPEAKNIAIMYTSDEANSIYQSKLALEACKELQLNSSSVTVPNDSSMIKQVTESLIGKYDAVYVPTDNLLSSNISIITQVLNDHGIPSVGGEKAMCEQGALASLSIDYYNIGVTAAHQALDILQGKQKIEDMPVAFVSAKDCEYVINTEVAKQLHLKIPNDLKMTKIGE